MSEQKLKPCPFCGGEAKLRLFAGRYEVACKECWAKMESGYLFDYEDQKKRAVNAWNRRGKDGSED